MIRPLCDSPFIYGLHDVGGEGIMLDAGVPGWIFVTEAIGFSPTDPGGGDYHTLSDRGLGVIVRLNAGYEGVGTLPKERYYDDFASRCANFVRSSAGAHNWVVGNEPNHPIEWPGADWDWSAQPPRPRTASKKGEPITPERYVRCYLKVREAIRSIPGHERDQVLTAAVGPWNNLLSYSTNPRGDWVRYFADVLQGIGPERCDGISLHTFTHGSDPGLVRSETRMSPPFSDRRFHFRAFQDFLAAVPPTMRDIPVYVTAADQGDEAWRNENTGWVYNAYTEIADWNKTSRPKIRALILYRWSHVPGDRWGIEGKQGVIEDFRRALKLRQTWESEPDRLTTIRRGTDNVEQRITALKAEIRNASQLADDLAPLKRTVDGLGTEVSQLQKQALEQHFSTLEAGVKGLLLELGLPATAPVQRPTILDLSDHLPTAKGQQYPKRSLGDIQRIVVHHTATAASVTPQRLAQAHVNQGKPGIPFHFIVGADGAIYWVQPLESEVAQTGIREVNAHGVAVALAGNFTATSPGQAQIDGASKLIAWLLSAFNLTPRNVVGRRELETVGSPGVQWTAGAAYKGTLLAAVRRHLDAPRLVGTLDGDMPGRIVELEGRVAELTSQASSASLLEQQVADLQAGLKAREAEVIRVHSDLQATRAGKVGRPSVIDLVSSLPKHPTLAPYPKRTKPVSMIVIHHADTPKTTTVQQIARYHVYGERRDKDGKLLKGPWPGIGYHFVIAPDGVIYQCQSADTRSFHVGGEPNNYSIGVSLIGRFMRTGFDGSEQAPADRIPGAAQLRSTAALAAWLLQEYALPIEKVVGHRDVWPGATACPGEYWRNAPNWRSLLVQQIEAFRGGLQDDRMEHYLLFWDHGTQWAETDWHNAQPYIAAFRPTAGFSLADAKLAQHVTIVGGNAGVSASDEMQLISAGAEVHRLSGKTEDDTKAMLDALVSKNTPWPGALPRGSRELGLDDTPALSEEAKAPAGDEWTVPDDWVAPATDLTSRRSASAQRRVNLAPGEETQPAV